MPLYHVPLRPSGNVVDLFYDLKQHGSEAWHIMFYVRKIILIRRSLCDKSHRVYQAEVSVQIPCLQVGLYV